MLKDCESGVAFKFCCPPCGGFYIGSYNIKHFKCLVFQHNSTSSQTGLPVKACNLSIRDHTIRSLNINIDTSKFRNNNKSALRLLESISIYKEKTRINTNDTASFVDSWLKFKRK